MKREHLREMKISLLRGEFKPQHELCEEFFEKRYSEYLAPLKNINSDEKNRLEKLGWQVANAYSAKIRHNENFFKN